VERVTNLDLELVDLVCHFLPLFLNALRFEELLLEVGDLILLTSDFRFEYARF